MERLAPAQHDLRFGRLSRSEEHLEYRRRIDGDQRVFRSARTASAGEGLGFTGARSARRTLSSATDGRSAPRLTSAMRYSESDMPSRAARALSLRCSMSGTFRSWIIFDM